MLKFFTLQKFLITSAGFLITLTALSIWKIPQLQVLPIQQQIDVFKKSKQAVDPKEIAALEKSKLDAENAARTVLVQGAGGLFAAAAAYIAWRNLKATQEKQVAERFSKAVEQLGNNNIHTRLGGIYALEQIAKDAEEKYYWQVMETLTAYVREQPKIPGTSEADIQTVLVVLSRRRRFYGHSLEPFRLNLNGVDLPGLEIPDNSQLTGIDLVSSNLQSADLARVDLRESRFFDANLHNAIFVGAKLRNSNFIRAKLQEADFGGADLRKARFSHAKLKKVIFIESNLQEADLGGADLQEADFMEANLQNASFEGANLDGAVLSNAKVYESRFYQASLRNVNLTNTEGLTDKQLGEAESYEGAFCDLTLNRVRDIFPAALRRGFGIAIRIWNLGAKRLPYPVRLRRGS